MDRDLRSRRPSAYGEVARLGSRERRYDLPRTVMRGGDLPRGGCPAGPGHAGRGRLSWSLGTGSLQGPRRRMPGTRGCQGSQQANPLLAGGHRLRAACGGGAFGSLVTSVRRDARSLGKTLLAVTLCIAVQVAALLSCSPVTAFAASGTVTEVRSTGTGDGVYPGHVFKVNDSVAYCASSYLGNPAVGDTLNRYDGAVGIPALDYVLYHGYDGVTVTSLGGLSADDSRLATQLAVWEVIGNERPDILSWPNHQGDGGEYHGNYGYENRMVWARVSHPDVAAAADKLITAARAYATAGGGGVEAGFATLYLNMGNMTEGVWYQHFVVVGQKTGRIALTKVSANEGLTTGNSGYSLKGAVYAVYSDEACKTEVGRLTTGEDGHAESGDLTAGTYWVREVTAPKGYELDTHAYKVIVEPGQTAQVNGEKVKDVPETGRIDLVKVSANEALTAGNNYYSLKGAVYAVYADKACKAEVTRLTTDESGHAESGTLALGTYWVREVTAPKGYQRDEATYEVQVVAGKTAHVNGGKVKDVPEVGRIDLVKVSANEALTAGNNYYSLKGAVYAVYADEACKAEVTRLTTGSDGRAESGDLALGTYWVREVTAPKGYQRDEATYEVQVEAGKTAHVNGKTVVDAPEVGFIDLTKVSAKENLTAGNDHYSLKGAVYGIYADEACKTEVMRLTTDASGYVKSGELVPGTYWVREVTAPKGYQRDEATYRVQVEAGKSAHVNGGKVVDTPQVGFIDLTKVSANEGLTSGNRCYSLAGAEYGVYSDSSCTTLVQKLTTNASGFAKSAELALGTYWVRELTAPLGFARDEATYEVQVEAGKTTHANGGKVTEAPVYETNLALVRKVDADGNLLSPELARDAQGNATLAGAEFTVRYYDSFEDPAQVHAAALRTWVFATDDSGRALFDQGHLVHGDKLFVSADGAAVLPLGTYTVQETKAPSGYQLTDTAAHRAQVALGEDGRAHWVTLDGWSGQNAEEDLGGRAIADAVRRGGLAIQKTDAQTGSAQGDASLAGIVFEVVNESERSVIVAGRAYAPGEVIEPLTLVTDEAGKASTSADALPLGTYRVRERATNESYLLTAEDQVVTISEADLGTVKSLGTSFANQVARGGVAVGKIDRELGTNQAQGASTLEGATIAVELVSSQSVLVGDELHAPGTVVTTLTTDAEGNACTGERDLPYGTYVLYETKAPEGYLLTPRSDWCPTVQVREDGVVVDLTGPEACLPELVARGDLSGVKVRESDMARLAGVPFVIESLSTGERHVVVTDENGEFSTEASWVSHESATNANDAAVTQTDDGTFVLADDTELSQEAGVWFCGANDGQACAPSDGRGALPYDRYRVSEVSCAANEGLALASFEVQVPTRVSRNGRTVSLGTIDDRPGPAIQTQLAYEGAGTAPAMDDIELVDVVSFSSLQAGAFYQLSGSLHLVGEDGSDLGIIATATTELVPDAADGHAEVRFQLDARELAGCSAVAFEVLTRGDEVVATHEDLGDEGQTVSFSSLGTCLTDKEGWHEALADTDVVLVDTVSYQGLVPGTAYDASGTLMDRATGEPVLDDAGQPITARTTFVPEEATGQMELAFAFPGASLAGRNVVAFERLYEGAALIAVHEDLDDEGQTVCFPSIATDLGDADGRHVTLAYDEVRLADTVRFENLTPGNEYVVHGTLMDRAAGEPLVIGELPVTGEAAFVPEETSGMTSVEFVLDARALAGHSVVAFETLSCGDHVVAVHEDLSDARQTATFPSIGTQAQVGRDGLDETLAEGVVEIVDTVSYQGLVPGVEYVVRGTVHVVGSEGEDAGALEDANGKVIVASTSFVPDESDGEAEVVYEVDVTGLGDRSLVAYEELYEGERLLAVHADIASEPQTIHVRKPEEPTPEPEPEPEPEPTPEPEPEPEPEPTPGPEPEPEPTPEPEPEPTPEPEPEPEPTPESKPEPEAPKPAKPSVPQQPTTPKGRDLPQTGAGAAAVTLVLVGCATLLIGIFVSMRKSEVGTAGSTSSRGTHRGPQAPLDTQVTSVPRGTTHSRRYRTTNNAHRGHTTSPTSSPRHGTSASAGRIRHTTRDSHRHE